MSTPPPAEIMGVAARFDGPDALLHAAHAARAAGYRIDAFTPFPLAAVNRLAGPADPAIPWTTFLSAVAGALFGLWMGWYINVVEYPLDVGGRPMAAWPAFILPAFELAVLFATLGALGIMLARNGLPRLNHPLFDIPGFARASDDGFFLLLETPHVETAARLLAEHGGMDLTEVRGA